MITVTGRSKAYKEDLKYQEQSKSLLPAQSGYPTGLRPEYRNSIIFGGTVTVTS